MNISLTKQLEEFINEKVKSGLYSSASEVIRDALRKFGEEEQKLAQLANLRREIGLGLQDIEKGRIVSGAKVFQKLRKKVSKKKF